MDLNDYPKPSVTVDTIIFTVIDDDLKVLLIKRGIKPFLNQWAIPGGFIHLDENLEDAAKRELEEETGVKDIYLEQLYTFGDVGRDPRGRVLTVAYMALMGSSEVKLRASTDSKEVKWFSVKNLPKLAFDHRKVLDYSLKRLRWKFEYTCAGFALLPKKFTVSSLQKIYEIVQDKEFDKRNFRKKLFSLNILKEEGMEEDVSYRPAKLYSLTCSLEKVVEII
jgi:8-oxo-dGTP diphosphatase